ncbi:DUF4157 domain-containing protein [Exilibacterium tricleocarpae]|uniref:DUF4157 domain-containing protein n=1 Tax=Exilibacterium tricleocarpae TaxID=2591008 RepID=A0A545T8H3_9GAMM|nr:DUF4157 domain-containing protein [Exilibacterium tricleocarpae]TQV73514.1 DUF4157 domain-containing protein [Exilibacterium tricleocarpae]
MQELSGYYNHSATPYPTPLFTTRLNNVTADEGRPLPGDMREVMEAIFGIDLSDIRLHRDDLPGLLGVKAFAVGRDIVVVPECQLDSPEGWHILGHELTHVVQQGMGLLDHIPDDRAHLHIDWLLETEAELIGSYAAQISDSRTLPKSPVYLSSPITRSSSRTIQCLMSLEDFKTATNAAGKRNKITAVQNELQAFHTLDSKEPKDYTAILKQLRKLYESCKTYHKERPGSNRKAGVDRLMREIGFEEVVLTSLAKYHTAGDELEKWDYLDECMARYQKIRGRSEFTRKLLGPELDALMTKYSSIKATDLTTAIVKKDIEALKAAAKRTDIPDILKSCITEVTAPNNLKNLDMTIWMPGAKYNTVRDKSLQKYTLKHTLAQGRGKNFRLGSLLHELTHVSIAETYSNSVLMLAIGSEATDTEILNEARLRKSHIGALKEAIKTTSDQDLVPFLKKEMTDKANYPVSGKLITYLSNFKTKMPEVEHKRLSALARSGLDSELIEYDTVINQMMMWCYLYNVDPENKVYKLLKTYARVAYDRRAAYRNGVRSIGNRRHSF